MTNKFAKVESFIGVLTDLNPKGQFKIEDENTIAIKGVAPQYLNLPLGYRYDTRRKSFTNDRNNEFMVIRQ